MKLQSLIVEGGTRLLNSFIQNGLWDEARVFINPSKNFGEGVKAPSFDLSKATEQKSGTDNLYTIKNPH